MTQTPRKYPSPVSISSLRRHFVDKYQFDEEQVELMLKSSRESLMAVLERTERALAGEQRQLDFEELRGVAHSLKGLFLNLGESSWAEVAREIENGAKQARNMPYREIVKSIRAGVRDVIDYQGKI